MFGAFDRPLSRSTTLGPTTSSPNATPDHRLDWLSAGHAAPPPASRARSYAKLSILDRYMARELLAPF
ncbi:MAG: hypothetical protein JO347_10140, partial [Candidatus Eremiobacteraeota bacterium]|nr:hypothetical protein [Candidatus Eremiobacteraeota bacterium]